MIVKNNKFNGLILIILPLILWIITYTLIPLYPTTFADIKIDFSWNADEVKTKKPIKKIIPDGLIIDYYTIWKQSYAVTTIPEWKREIYEKLKIPPSYKLILHTINTLECWDENGFCLNSSDSWPFQINQIHWSDYKYSAYLIKQGKIAIENAKKTNDWHTVLAIRDTLFTFQVKWTYRKMQGFEKKCKSDKLSKFTACEWWYHNWNTRPSKWFWQFRDFYAYKASLSVSILWSYYNSK